MPLTSQEIQKIASLAKLDLSSGQEEKMLQQINAFFEIVEQIKSVDTSSIAPLSHPLATVQEVSLRLRDDQVSETNQRELNQKSAPKLEKGLFLVPKVIES
jgi:aspartyl-tRNA(Asn)/glutamyl-tRNA(Gln) amidotransferase subunit C